MQSEPLFVIILMIMAYSLWKPKIKIRILWKCFHICMP